MALKRDPGYSDAHQLLGSWNSTSTIISRRGEFQQAVDRNPYAGIQWYYLATCELKLDRRNRRNGISTTSGRDSGTTARGNIN